MRPMPSPAALALYLAVALLPLAASGQPLKLVSIATVPAQPVAREPLVVRVTVDSPCRVSPGRLTVAPGTLKARLQESCDPRPPRSRQTVELGPVVLDRGGYTLQVTTPSEFGGERILGSAQVIVLRNSFFLLEIPGAPPTDGAPFDLTITGFYPCGKLEGPELDGNVVRFHVEGPCPLPVAPMLLSQTVPVGPLPPGDYRVRLTETVDGPLGAVDLPFTVYDADLCVPSETALCLQEARFRVAATWSDFQGGSGEARAVPLAERDDTGLFWFFSPDNVELTVKVLDGCGVNGHHWVFLAPGSTTGWEVTVTDTLRGESRSWDNEAGELPALVADTTAFATCP